MRNLKLIAILLGGYLFLSGASATTITFEDLADSTLVGNSYAYLGVNFTNAIALQAGVSLNEIDFPPHSGQIAVGDTGSPIFISFNSPVHQISAWFAHSTDVTLTGFNASGVPVGVFVDPLPFTGADELITLNFLTGASSVEISSTQPGTYVFDDLSFPTQSVPDNGGTFALATISTLLLFLGRRLIIFAGKPQSNGRNTTKERGCHAPQAIS